MSDDRTARRRPARRPASGAARRAPHVSHARRAAYEVVRRTFEDGAWTDRAFRATATRHRLEPRERAHAQRLAYGAVQMRRTIDHLLSGLADRAPESMDAPLLAALRLGAYELLFSEAAEYAAVGEAVELAKPAGRGAAGLANAVLRRLATDRSRLLGGLSDDSPETAAIRHSYPEWIARTWWEELGADVARALMAAGNEPPERAFRVNRGRTSIGDVLGRFGSGAHRAEEAASPSPRPRGIVVADGPIGADGAEMVERGEVTPQSRASAFVVELLDPRPGDRVLDLCAGPGIKTTQIAQAVAGTADEVGSPAGVVDAVEVDPARAREIRELSALVGVSGVRLHVADAAESRPSSGYDRVLVDPPCSGLGTLAQRPDARWRRSQGDRITLASVQRRILRRAMGAVGPGGLLAYSTCTISRAEGEDVVSEVLTEADGAEFRVVDLGREHRDLASTHDARFLQTRPDRDGTSGFFIALLRRVASGE